MKSGSKFLSGDTRRAVGSASSEASIIEASLEPYSPSCLIVHRCSSSLPCAMRS